MKTKFLIIIGVVVASTSVIFAINFLNDKTITAHDTTEHLKGILENCFGSKVFVGTVNLSYSNDTHSIDTKNCKWKISDIQKTSGDMFLILDSYPGVPNKEVEDKSHHYVKKKTLFFHNKSIMDELTRHSPTLKNWDYHVNLVTTHSFKSFSNAGSGDSRIASQKVTEDIEFEIYLTKWRLDRPIETKLIDTWSYHSEDHMTEYETELLPGEYVTWQILPIALSESKFDWERINTETVMTFDFTLIDE